MVATASLNKWSDSDVATIYSVVWDCINGQTSATLELIFVLCESSFYKNMTKVDTTCTFVFNFMIISYKYSVIIVTGFNYKAAEI